MAVQRVVVFSAWLCWTTSPYNPDLPPPRGGSPQPRRQAPVGSDQIRDLPLAWCPTLKGEGHLASLLAIPDVWREVYRHVDQHRIVSPPRRADGVARRGLLAIHEGIAFQMAHPRGRGIHVVDEQGGEGRREPRLPGVNHLAREALAGGEVLGVPPRDGSLRRIERRGCGPRRR